MTVRDRRLSVGVVSPLPPVRSGISDYTAELLASLRRLVDVAAYEPGRAGEALEGGHDVLLFQIGNDPLHVGSYEALTAPGRTTPAVVTLHDFVLHHLFAAGYLDSGDEANYARELEANEGDKGRSLWGRMKDGTRIPVWDLDPWSYPMNGRLLAAAETVVVHSRLVAGSVLRRRPETPVVEIPHHVVPAPRTERAEARRALSLPPGRPVAVTLGVVTPAKRVNRILEAFGRLPADQRPFLFVGGAVGEDDALHGLVRDEGLEGDVAFGGYLSEVDFWRAASAADLAVNLRHPTMGETSGAVCRLAGFGLPLVVSDIGWFRELPDTFASKIPVGGDEVERLAREISRIAFDPVEARRRGEAAAAWGLARHPDRIAEAYASVLEDAADGWTRPSALSGRLAAELAALGVGQPGRAPSREPDATVVAAVAGRLAGVLPRPRPGAFDGSR